MHYPYDIRDKGQIQIKPGCMDCNVVLLRKIYVCLWCVNEEKPFAVRFHVWRISQRLMLKHLALSYLAVNVNIFNLF